MLHTIISADVMVNNGISLKQVYEISEQLVLLYLSQLLLPWLFAQCTIAISTTPGEKLKYFGRTWCHGDNCNYLQINHYCIVIVIIHWLFLDQDVKLALSWHRYMTYSDFLPLC